MAKKGGQRLMEMSQRKRASKEPEQVSEPTVPTQRYRSDTPLRLDQMSGPADMEMDNFAPPIVDAPPPLPEEDYAPFNVKQFAENIRTLEPPPFDPKEEKINTINDKVDVLMDTFRQTLEAQKAKQDEEESVRVEDAENFGPIDVTYNPKSGASQSYPSSYGNIKAPPPPPQPVTSEGMSQAIAKDIPFFRAPNDSSFDPEGVGYDYETAKKFGLKPDPVTGRWPSRVPETGQILKGRGHDTFNETEIGEAELGYEIAQGEDGKYYSQKKENLYSYELSPQQILGIGDDIPNDKLVVAPRYDTFDEMRAEFNTALKNGYPLPPIAYANGDEYKVAEVDELKRFVMSADDMKAYNVGIVSSILESAQEEQKQLMQKFEGIE